MARKSAESFAKRQKEIARKEKQQKKFEKRLERRKQKGPGGSGPDVVWESEGNEGGPPLDGEIEPGQDEGEDEAEEAGGNA